MNKYIVAITTKFHPLANALRRYRVAIFVISFLGIYTFLIMQVNMLSSKEPDPATVNSQQQTTKRLTIDQGSIDRILELEEQNIDVRSLFEQARQNPFNE